MRTVNIHEAKTHLSRLVEDGREGRAVHHRQGGQADGKVEAIETPEAKAKRQDRLSEGKFNVPDDFDEMGREEIERMFHGDDE